MHPNTDVPAVLATLSSLVELAQRLELPQVAPPQEQPRRFRDRYIDEEEEDNDDDVVGGNPGANFPDLVPREEAARVATSGHHHHHAVDSLTAQNQRSESARRWESLLLAALLLGTALILHLFPPAPYFE